MQRGGDRGGGHRPRTVQWAKARPATTASAGYDEALARRQQAAEPGERLDATFNWG